MKADRNKRWRLVWILGKSSQAIGDPHQLFVCATAELPEHSGMCFVIRGFMAWFALLYFQIVAAGAADASATVQPTPDHPLAVKVVILTTFEIGADTGDTPGEFQYWVERRNLNIIFPMKMGYHDVRTDGNGVIGTVTGMGTANAATSVMALATDPRFDFSKAYWILAGIAGIDPKRGSLASAVWADCVIDGDVAYEIDGREIPANWNTGVIPWERTRPFEGPPPTDIKQIYILNRDLVNWAYNDTKGVALPEDSDMKKLFSKYVDFPETQRPPKVMIGATLATSRFWEGALMSQWAEKWVDYWSGGAGRYVTTACEDAGVMRALTSLAKGGKVDINRVLILRTASDFDQPPIGETPAQSLATKDSPDHLAGYLPSLESAFRVGNKVVSDLLSKWPD